MTIDIDKLKSLIRLANNNPNDNEANLAARKVCKFIASSDFKDFELIDKRQQRVPFEGALRPGRSPTDDFMRAYEFTKCPGCSEIKWIDIGPGLPVCDECKGKKVPNTAWCVTCNKEKPGIRIGLTFICDDCKSYTKYKESKKCPRCGFDLGFDKTNMIYQCDNIACNMIITEAEWANIGK